ncbi:ROK family protein [bacterium]|nr:ROK family protein [bacterium]
MTGRRFLGVDLGATNTKMIVLSVPGDGDPAIQSVDSVRTGGEDGHDAALDRLIRVFVAKLDADGPFDGFGMGTPGLFDVDGVVEIFTNLPGQWRGVRLRDRLEAGLGMPVTLINDARAFTLAEGRMGAGRGARVLAAMTLGTGIGGGLMIDGKVFMGSTGIAGEISHQTVLLDGPMCGCGNRGCAEALARSDVMAEMADRSSVEEVFAGLAEGDPACVASVETAAKYLGIAIANVVTFLGPDRIVIGGGIAAAGDAMLDPIRDAVWRHVTLVPERSIDIVRASLGPEAGAIGAALAASEAPALPRR